MKRTTLRAALGDSNLLGRELAGDSWLAWRSLLLASMGEKLTEPELEHFRTLTGRDEPPHQRVAELWAVTGRRSGKSTAAAVLAVYLACLCKWPLSPGEVGHVIVVAPDRAQGGVILDQVRAILNRSPILRQLVARDIRKETAEQIDLTTGVTIAVCAASLRSLRGRTAIAVVADEVAFWPSESASDTEILAAARATLLTTRGPLIAVSAPRGKHGVLWDVYQRHFGPGGCADVLVAQGNLNPTLELATGAQFEVEAAPLPAPALPVVVREIVPDMPARHMPARSPHQPPRPRKAKRQEPPAAPTPFHIMIAPDIGGDGGRIEEGYFVVQGNQVLLTTADGTPLGERRVILRDPLFTARSLLREKISARQAGPYHGALKYPVLKY